MMRAIPATAIYSIFTAGGGCKFPNLAHLTFQLYPIFTSSRSYRASSQPPLVLIAFEAACSLLPEPGRLDRGDAAPDGTVILEAGVIDRQRRLGTYGIFQQWHY